MGFVEKPNTTDLKSRSTVLVKPKTKLELPQDKSLQAPLHFLEESFDEEDCFLQHFLSVDDVDDFFLQHDISTF